MQVVKTHLACAQEGSRSRFQTVDEEFGLDGIIFLTASKH